MLQEPAGMGKLREVLPLIVGGPNGSALPWSARVSATRHGVTAVKVVPVDGGVTLVCVTITVVLPVALSKISSVGTRQVRKEETTPRIWMRVDILRSVSAFRSTAELCPGSTDTDVFFNSFCLSSWIDKVPLQMTAVPAGAGKPGLSTFNRAV